MSDIGDVRRDDVQRGDVMPDGSGATRSDVREEPFGEPPGEATTDDVRSNGPVQGLSTDGTSGDGRLTTDQIANPGAAQQTAPPAGGGDTATSDSEEAQLLDPRDRDTMTQRWRDIQADFVDQPQKAMKDADALVAGLMQQLAQMFSEERSQLEAQWSRGDEVSTEDLRVSLQRYRAFFERLLSV
jgi:hypothetical protein